jgi:hypothetical protein
VSIRGVILDEAKAVIEGPRDKAYGPPGKNFERIAELMSAVLGDKLREQLTVTDVALVMIAVKLGRLMETPDHWDTWVDVAGYAACGGEVSNADSL